MTIGSFLSARVHGHLSPVLLRAAAADIDAMIAEALRLGISRWQDQGFHRYDDLEINCAVQLFRWCREAIRSNARLRALSINLEWVQVSAAVLSGDESADGLPRPDMRLTIGEHSGRSVECKRLTDTAAHTRGYVEAGLMRFKTGRYGMGEDRGVMVGFVQAGDVDPIVERLNECITSDPTLGPLETLHPTATGRRTFRSSHRRADGSTIELDHYAIDVR